jgi:hypothetical protein
VAFLENTVISRGNYGFFGKIRSFPMGIMAFLKKYGHFPWELWLFLKNTVISHGNWAF